MPEQQSPLVPCIVVGGAADGLLIDVRMDAEVIQLAAPSHAKPLESSTQQNIEVEEISDIYVVHPIGLQNDEETPTMIYAIAVPEDIELTEAFQELLRAYALYTAEVDWNKKDKIQTN